MQPQRPTPCPAQYQSVKKEKNIRHQSRLWRRVRSIAIALFCLCLLSACAITLPEVGADRESAFQAIEPAQRSEGQASSKRMVSLPTTVAEIEIAQAGGTVMDAAYDSISNQIYVSDIDGNVTVLDGSTFEPLMSYSAWGYLVLDTESRYLYVTPDEFPLPLELTPEITVFELGKQAGDLPTLVGSLPGAAIDFDVANGRLYVGEPLAFGQNPSDAAGVRIYDSQTLEQIGVSEQGGRPLYNPTADKLLIVAYTVFVADAESGEVISELPVLPTDQERFLWCNGCTWAKAAYHLPDQSDGAAARIGVLAHPQTVRGHASYPLLSFDAETLAPLSQPILREERGPDCGNPLALRLPSKIGDMRIHHAFDANYITNNYLEIYSDEADKGEGDALARRFAGLAPLYVDALNGQIITVDGLLIDLASFSPITTVEPLCIFDQLPNGDLVARSLSPWEGGEMLRIVSMSPQPVTRTKPMISSGLLGYQVAQIVPSPTYGQAGAKGSQTLFVRTEYEPGLFRSTDGGETWVLLDFGLPWNLLEGMAIGVSPDYANDQTIFLAGPNVHHRGLGVWRSESGGDHWRPLWNGLDDLRIASLFVSPNFSLDVSKQGEGNHDQSLVIQTIEGEIYRSTDAGAEWVRLANVSAEGLLDNLAAFLADESQSQALDQPPEPLVRIDFMTGDLVVRKNDTEQSGGEGTEVEEWSAVDIELPLLPNGASQYWSQVIASPGDPYAFYALSDRTIWRTLDGGINWLQIPVPELSTLPEGAYIRTAVLAGDPYGDTVLLVGTSHGDLWAIK